MQVKLSLVALAVILILAITLAQASAYQSDSVSREDRREFLRRILATLDNPAEMDRRYGDAEYAAWALAAAMGRR